MSGYSRIELFGVDQKCDQCGKGLRPFKGTKDWNRRKMHKTCWKTYTLMLQIKQMFKEQEERQKEYDKRYDEWRREGDLAQEQLRTLSQRNDQLQNSLDFHRRINFH